MYRIILYTLGLFLFFPFLARGQEVIANSGDVFSKGNFSLSWTIGEAITQTFTAPDFLLTNGFHQSNLIISSVHEKSMNTSIKAFPNPTQDFIDIKIENNGIYHGSLTYLNGLIINDFNIHGEAKVDLSQLPSGVYILNISNSNKQISGTFRITKIQ